MNIPHAIGEPNIFHFGAPVRTTIVQHVPDLARLFVTNDAKWLATLERDARADGLFVYAVRTTGIYCRPICPSRKPKRGNVTFYRAMDEAEAPGFRSCKVCRPKLAARLVASKACNVRPAAILFADIVGSSSMAKRLRPDEMMERLNAFHCWTGRLVTSHDGVVHKNLGDGFMAVFGDDVSRAEDAFRAVRCGVALMDQAAALQSTDDHAVAIGIGVHYGLVAFGDAGGARALLGDTVNVASRLESATRRLGRPLVVSDESMRAIQIHQRAAIADRLEAYGNIRLPGCGLQRVWAVRNGRPKAPCTDSRKVNDGTMRPGEESTRSWHAKL